MQFVGEKVWLRLGACVIALIAAGAAFAKTWGSFSALAAMVDSHNVGLFEDFRAHYHPMAEKVFSLGQPVDGFRYGPFAAIVLWPLGFLSEPSAEIAWAVMMTVGVGWIVWFASGFESSKFGMTVLGCCAVLLSTCIVHDIRWGNFGVLIGAFTVLAVYLQLERRPALAGLVLGFATALKPIPLVLGLIWIVRGKRVEAIYFLGSLVVFLLLVPVLFLGVEGATDFYRLTIEQTRAEGGYFSADVNSQYLPNVLAIFVDASANWKDAAESVREIALIACAFLTLQLLFWTYKSRSDPTMDLPCSIAAMVSLPLWLKPCWPHYLVLLGLAQAFVLSRIGTLQATGDLKGPRLAVMTALLASSLAASTIPALWIIPAWYSYVGLGCISYAAISTLFSLVLIPKSEFTHDSETAV